MRRKQLNRLANEGKLTYGQLSGAYDDRAGVAAYRTIEGREYKPIDEKVAVSRIERAAERRLHKRNKRRQQFIQGEPRGQEQAPEVREVSEAQPEPSNPASRHEVRFDFE